MIDFVTEYQQIFRDPKYLKASRNIFWSGKLDAFKCLQYPQLWTELDHDHDRRNDVVSQEGGNEEEEGRQKHSTV